MSGQISRLVNGQHDADAAPKKIVPPPDASRIIRAWRQRTGLTQEHSAGSSNVSGGPSNPNNTTCPNPSCPSRLRVIDSSLANPRSLAKDGSAHSGRTGGPTRRFPGLTGSTFAPACS